MYMYAYILGMESNYSNMKVKINRISVNQKDMRTEVSPG